MSRKPALKPNTGNREELLERRVAQLEARARQTPARVATVSGMWDIRGKLLSGSPFTADDTFDVPAGVYRILVVATAAGGAALGSNTGNNTWFYVASLSGGAVTYAVKMFTEYCGGGHGGMCMAWLDVTPFETITLTIGAGAASSDGGDTVITLPSTDGAITLTGGKAGGLSTAGAGGVVTSTVVTARNPVIIDTMANGGMGASLFFKDSGNNIIGGWAAPSRTAYDGFLIPGTNYGAGAYGSAAAGEDGAVYVYY